MCNYRLTSNAFWTGVYLVLAVRLLSLILGSFSPPSHPHIWRQVDTFSVTIRYWSRWTVESDASRLLPAVLNSGETSGIVAMEAPLLNLATAPAFAAGPYYGHALASLIVIFAIFGLTLWNARIWRAHGVGNWGKDNAALLFPIFSFSAVYVGKYMPDPLSVLLVLTALGLAWGPCPRRFFWAFLLGTAGVLMKPTSAAVLFLLVVDRRVLRSTVIHSAWILPAAAIAITYYSLGISELHALQEVHPVFGVQPRAFPETIQSFLSRPSDIVYLLLDDPLFPGGMPLIGGFFLYKAVRGRAVGGRLWLCAFLQLTFIVAVDGEHAFSHDYYFLATAPTFCLLLVRFLEECQSDLVRGMFLVACVVKLGEIAHQDAKYLYRELEVGQSVPWTDCRALIDRNPQIPWKRGEVFRSDGGRFPALGVCFGERVGADEGSWGIFWKGHRIPGDCRTIDSSRRVAVVDCRQST